MLQTDTSWEIPTDTKVLRTLLGQPGLRRYHLFELALNVPIYRLDLVLPQGDDGEQSLRRFRFDRLRKLLNFVQGEHPVFSQIVQETPFVEGKKPELREISAIFSAIDECGEEVFLIDSDHGRFRIGHDMAEDVGVVFKVSQIWPTEDCE